MLVRFKSPRGTAAERNSVPKRRWIRNTIALTLGIAAGALAVLELETSALQSRIFSRAADRLHYRLEPGPTSKVAYPAGGPFDVRRGYASLPTLIDRFAAHGFVVSEQARMSKDLRRLIDLGIAPPYREPPAAGLVIRDAGGNILYDARARERAFQSFEEVPPLVVDTLLFIENKELLDIENVRRNPTLEWDRMAKAAFLFIGSKLGFSVSVEGGSTLATQLEKFRHSPAGRTSSAQDKLRQIASATLKAYRDGVDTTDRRHEIIVDYLNSMPLAAAAGFGEVNGLGEGLEAWFGLNLGEVAQTLLDAREPLDLRASHYAHVLALLASLPAPSVLLGKNRDALRERMHAFLAMMERQGIVDPELATAVQSSPLHFLARAPSPPRQDFVDHKATSAVRNELLRMTGVDNHYVLNQLQLEVDAAVDSDLQDETIELFRKLGDRKFTHTHGLGGRYMLAYSDPSKVLYGLLLYERTPGGNLLRAQVDTLDQPFDLNRGAKVELGSTAKLRTLTHYLEIIAMLYRELSPLDLATLRIRYRAARDPLTAWVADVLSQDPDIDLAELLDQALERRYSANAGEAFFTGGGVRYFSNFDRYPRGRPPTLRIALQHSINLPFVRLMRDLVRFHEVRLPYDSDVILEDTSDPLRRQMLEEIAENESYAALRRAFRRFHDKEPGEIIESVIRRDRRREKRLRKLTILHYAWFPDSNDIALAVWLNRWFGPTPPSEVERMQRAYGNPNLDLADYGYLASQHTLVLWAAGQILRDPQVGWDELLERSAGARVDASRWLFKERNVRPQNRRLRIRIERDAFARMTPYWQRIGFPFDRLIPSYATALGSSGDRPTALAELMGIIVNDGIRRPLRNIVSLRLARDTPYETAFEPAVGTGERMLDSEVAAALRDALTGVVRGGTASLLAETFRTAAGVQQVGGKTGTGDNRRITFNRWGEVKSSHAINRTASFTFFIGDRFFGVITAFVPGREAEAYQFTSKLPLAVLRLLAPAINERLARPVQLELAQADSASDAAQSTWIDSR